MKKLMLYIFIILLLCSCSKKKYTVNIIDSRGNLLDSFKIDKGSNLLGIDTPMIDGYILVSLELDGEEYDINSPIYEDITLEAIYTKKPVMINNYTVTFDFGDKIKTMTVKDGNMVSRPSDPSRDGYKFLGWYLDDVLYDFNQVVYEDMVLVAKWEAEYISINYQLDGGIGIYEEKIIKGSVLDKPDDPSKLGYKFLGWYLDDILYDFNQEVYEDMVLVAKWEVIKYVKVIFDTDNGSSINSQVIPSGSLISDVNTPLRDGYKFLYWQLDGEIFDVNSPIYEDITLKAIYQKIE